MKRFQTIPAVVFTVVILFLAFTAACGCVVVGTACDDPAWGSLRSSVPAQRRKDTCHTR